MSVSMTRPTWAILSTTPLAELERVAAAKPRRYGALLRVQRGSKKYHAIVDVEPGSEHSGEDEMAAALSGAHRGKHYVLHLHEDAPRVAVYVKGRLKSELDEDPLELAASLGVALAEETVWKSEIVQALVVEGRPPSDVIRALGVEDGTDDESLRIASSPRGTTVTSNEVISLHARDLSKVLGTRVYAVHWHTVEREFACDQVEAGATVACFEHPLPARPDPAAVSELLGETTPAGIIRVLGLDWDVGPAA
jgi:hypothetical protein